MRPSGDLSREGTGYLSLWREIDTLLCTIILLLAAYLASLAAGARLDPGDTLRRAAEFLGFTAPVFFLAAAFLAWATGALLLELTGMSPLQRRWTTIAGTLFYVENAAPFVGLLECFISIVKALLAYSAAGATPQGQSAMIASIAIALGASAAGCFVALCAHSLKTIVLHRLRDDE